MATKTPAPTESPGVGMRWEWRWSGSTDDPDGLGEPTGGAWVAVPISGYTPATAPERDPWYGRPDDWDKQPPRVPLPNMDRWQKQQAASAAAVGAANIPTGGPTATRTRYNAWGFLNGWAEARKGRNRTRRV
jgi:hypothetical protein